MLEEVARWRFAPLIMRLAEYAKLKGHTQGTGTKSGFQVARFGFATISAAVHSSASCSSKVKLVHQPPIWICSEVAQSCKRVSTARSLAAAADQHEEQQTSQAAGDLTTCSLAIGRPALRVMFSSITKLVK